MKVSDYIVFYLEQRGVHVIFGYIGGMITHLVDSIASNPKVCFVQTYHEQTAAMAAEGYALETNNIGVAISTSGPGATNMITGIADAYFDSIPVLYITGQVNTYEYKYDKPIRQQGFQETDVVSIVKPITKYAVLVDKAENVKYELDKALHIALSGRKGPVLLDLPMNIQRAEIEPANLKSYTHEESEVEGKSSSSDWEQIKELISQAKKPLLLIGGGCRNCDAEKLNGFVRFMDCPVITSLMGRGIIDETYANYIGMVGSYGNRCANMSVNRADLLIALGTRLDTRQTGALLEGFMPTGKVLHVDIDADELCCHRLKNRVPVNCSVSRFLTKLMSMDWHGNTYGDWNEELRKLKFSYNQDNEVERFVENKSPYRFFQYLNELTKEGDVICTDVGQNQMWAAQSLILKSNQHYITSGGLAPMGYSMPAAIGAAFAGKQVVYAITGDGGFHISIQSLLLIAQYNLPIKVMVMNNHALGMITQFQHLYFDNRMAATTKDGGYFVPDIQKMAESCGLRYFYLDEELLADKTLRKEIEKCRNCVIEYAIWGLTTVSPKLEYNKPINKPSPQLPE